MPRSSLAERLYEHYYTIGPRLMVQVRHAAEPPFRWWMRRIETAADDAQARLDVVTARPMLPSRHLASAAAGDAVVTDLAPQA
jgi:hypothetical protein